MNVMPVSFLLFISGHYGLKRLIGCQTPLLKLSRRSSENLVPPASANFLLDLEWAVVNTSRGRETSPETLGVSVHGRQNKVGGGGAVSERKRK